MEAIKIISFLYQGIRELHEESLQVICLVKHMPTVWEQQIKIYKILEWKELKISKAKNKWFLILENDFIKLIIFKKIIIILFYIRVLA